MNLRIADLHTHSIHSDGAHTPSEVVRLALAAGVSVLALTDHDSTRGNGEAAAESSQVGIEFVPGIEISALHDGAEYHILGYFVESCSVLDAYVESMSASRDDRLEGVVARLERAGLQPDIEVIREMAAGVATRSHIARHLVDIGAVESVREAFEHYLGPGCVGYVPAARISVVESIELIHDAGGCAALAHPGEWVGDREVEAFRNAGLDAIETIHPSHDDRLTEYHSRLAGRLGLLECGGSDFHAIRDGAGASPGAFHISVFAVDALRNRAARYSRGPAPDR